jgi:hypothetical protein
VSGAFTLTLDTTAPTATWRSEAGPGYVDAIALTNEPATIVDATLTDTAGGVLSGVSGAGGRVRFVGAPAVGNVTVRARLTDAVGNSALREFTFDLASTGLIRGGAMMRRLIAYARAAGHLAAGARPSGHLESGSHDG